MTGAMKSPRRSTDSFVVCGRYVFITSQRTGSSHWRFGQRWVTRARLVQLLQDLERVSVRLHEIPRLLDLAVRTDQERRANHAFAATRALAPRAIRVVHLAVRVAEQVEVEAIFLLERLVRGRVVLRHTEYGHAEAAELREVVVQLARLGGASRRVVLWIEVQEVRLAFERVAGDGL